MSRSRVSKSLLLMVLFLVVPATNRLAASEEKESAELAKQRAEMKGRQRRVIYNNDGYEMFLKGANTPDGFLAIRMKATLNTQVDSIFYCTGAATMFTHQAKVGETYGKYAEGMLLKTNIEALDKQYKTDSLALTVKFCHENDLEVFFTHRINDVHDSFMDMELSTWKREHPECLMGKRGDSEKYPFNDARNRWTALDFEIPEVQDYLIAIIDDVLARYDLDGIDIDYLRVPMFFRPNRIRKPVTSDQVTILTGFQRRVRDVAYKHGNRRGRPILVSARVPVTKSMCRYVGIDIEQWLEEDLLDVLTTAIGAVPFTNPTRELVELGHAHDVPVYPAIGSLTGEALAIRTTAHWRGAAANFWHAGADGVYLFNTFPRKPQHPHFTELGDPKNLATANKIFIIDKIRFLDRSYNHAILQSHILPLDMDSSGKPCEITLPIGDDVAGAAKEGRLKLAKLRVQFDGRSLEDKIEVRLNGDIVESTEEDLKSGWVTYAVDPSQYRHGDNALALRVSDSREKAKPVVVASVELRVDYNDGLSSSN